MFSYTNRKDVTFYIHAAQTSTGKTRYTMRRSSAGALAKLPGGYEVIENVHGQVSIRKTKPRQITQLEEKLVQAVLERLGLLGYRLEAKDRYLTVFEPGMDCDAVAEVVGNPFGFEFGGLAIGSQLEKMLREKLGNEKIDDYIQQKKDENKRRLEKWQRYSPVFRFSLADRKARLFDAERMSYMGQGGWHFLQTMPLEEATQKYLPHLGQESFFDLV